MPQGPTAYSLTGGNGGETLNDGESMTTGKIAMWIHARTDTAFTTLTGNMTGAGDDTLPAGHDLGGQYTAITVTTGTIDVYFQ